MDILVAADKLFLVRKGKVVDRFHGFPLIRSVLLIISANSKHKVPEHTGYRRLRTRSRVMRMFGTFKQLRPTGLR